MAYKVMVDAGHGGYDNGAMYNGRKEKDDNLALALAVGEILAENGVDVDYTRTTDVYQSPSEKARIANASGADLFISIHRNSSPIPNTYSGVQTLIYNHDEFKDELANNINSELANLGFNNLGISIRPNLTVLKRTQMPGALLEVGFINTDFDNQLFDERFDEIALAIANGVLETIGDAPVTEPTYRVQVGLYSNYSNAMRMYNRLLSSGNPAEIITLGGLYAVLSGSFNTYSQAADFAATLEGEGFPTAVIAL